MKLTLHVEDLSLETLSSIKADLSRYAHLAMYRETWQEIVITIEERARASQGKVIPNITGVSPTQPTPTQPRPTSYLTSAQQEVEKQLNAMKENLK